MNNVENVFIVGSSRSGTTMMGRILNNHSAIFSFNELHFFGNIWTNLSTKKTLSSIESVRLLARLICIQEEGLFNQNNTPEYYKRATLMLNKNETRNPLEIYKLFLKETSYLNLSSISCEQTPKNIYYIKEILQFFPDAKIINMIRDPRDVLLSQKNKWKRKFLGAAKIPFSEAFRSYINYHPIIMAKIWNSSLRFTKKYESDNRMILIKFEDLLSDPEKKVKEICAFLNINFQKDMLNVPLVGSSTEYDSANNFIIDKSKIQKWKRGGLLDAEIYLSQLFSNSMMNYFGYELRDISYPPPLVLFYLLILPFKLIIAFFVNIKNMGNISESLKKRLFI